MSDPIHTRYLTDTAGGIAAAADVLASGGLLALPTETVYGLGADARVDHACARIFAAKGRPQFNPLIVHLAGVDQTEQIGMFDATARKLADAFWPGPLTLVVPLRETAGISPLVTAGNPTIGLRVPNHPLARAVLTAFGGPVAAPSANPSGKISPTMAKHVQQGLDGLIEAVIDGGACTVGVESTIVGCVDGRAVLLRPGGVSIEDIADVIGYTPEARGDADPISAPGQLSSHYAPDADVSLNVTTPAPDQVWVGFGPDCADAELNLSPTGDLTEAAANLFQMLRHADEIADGARRIAFAPVPDTGLGLAINDRLRRAAAPRDQA